MPGSPSTAGTSIAALFVPGSQSFRNIVDRKKRSEAREAARAHLIAEIEKRVDGGAPRRERHPYWKSYEKLLERRDSLLKVAMQDESAISRDDRRTRREKELRFPISRFITPIRTVSLA